VALTGELDLATTAELRAHIARLTGGGAVHIVFDMANLTFMDARGLSVILATCEQLGHRGGSLAVRNASPQVLHVFEIYGLVGPLSVTDGPNAPSDCPKTPAVPRCRIAKRTPPTYSTFSGQSQPTAHG
jgi:anti-anti-sigma factor